MSAVAAIDALLPQTQCTRCGYDGCLPYATAIAAGAADMNRCPPGGTATIVALAALLQRAPRPLDPACGPPTGDVVAWIDVQACIGCARCLPPCPVDAIIGAQRLLHTVFADICTGCELCINSCPVDCISMQPRSALPEAAPAPGAVSNRQRYEQHRRRLQQLSATREQLLDERKRLVTP